MFCQPIFRGPTVSLRRKLWIWMAFQMSNKGQTGVKDYYDVVKGYGYHYLTLTGGKSPDDYAEIQPDRKLNFLSSVCLARGRSFTVQISPLVERCDVWHKSPISDIWDGSIVASSVLRRDLVRIKSLYRLHSLMHECQGGINSENQRNMRQQ